jgi:hypothetical protein
MAFMANHYPSCVFLVAPELIPAAPLRPHQDISEMMDSDRHMYSGGSRHGEFNEHVRLQCERVGLRGLEFLHGPQPGAPTGERAVLFHGDDLPTLQEGLTALMRAFRDDPALPLGPRETVVRDMAAEPSFVADLDSGQYIDYLHSLQDFARQAEEEGLALLYVQFDGG